MIKNIALALLPFLAFVPLTVRAQGVEPNPGAGKGAMIRVSGYGSVMTTPDMAVITAGIATEDADPQAALAQNTAATAKMLAELKAAGIDPKDLQTRNFSMFSQFRTEPETKRQVLVYRVSNTVAVTVRAVNRVGELLGRVAAAGSNQIGGPSFMLSAPEKPLREARQKAVQDALEKAQTFASAAGLTLGPVLEISDDANFPLAPMRGTAMSLRQVDAVPIEAGQETVEARVVMTFALVPAK